MTILIHTLTCPHRHLTTDFDPNHFCDRDAHGDPFNSTHLVSQNDRYIGTVFRDTPDLFWEICLAGEVKYRQGSSEFDEALERLIEWNEERRKEDQEWRVSVGLGV